MRKFLSAIAVASAASLALLAPPASAGVITLGPGSPITSTITGIGTVSFTPTPATEILQVTDPEFSSDFPNQNPTTVASGIGTVFSVPTPNLTLKDDGPIPASYSQSVPSGFNFAAIHNAQGELIFYYSTSETNFTLDGSNQLSNARFYACAADTSGCNETPPVPEPSALALVGSALVIFGFAWRRRSV